LNLSKSKLKKCLRTLVSSIVRNRPFHLRSSIKRKDLVNIGCGSRIRPEFIGIDYEWKFHLDACWDVTKGLPLESDSVSGAFSQHCFEHLSLEQGFKLLQEIWRVLKPNGTLRISVPDGELYIRRYLEMLEGGQEAPPHAEKDRFNGVYLPILSVNRIMREHGHKFIYDYAIFELILSQAGFTDISRARFMESRDHRLAIDSEKRASESLYVEASKPSNQP